MLERIQKAELEGPAFAVTKTSVRCPMPRVTTLVVYGFWEFINIRNKKLDSVGTYNCNVVILNDSHGVSINTESLQSIRTSIYQSQSMCLASRELESRHSCIVGTFRVVTWCLGRTVKVHLSVDQIVVGSWSRISTRAESIRYDLIVICMEPVGDEDWTKINVVICVLWPVDDHWSQ